MTVTLRMRRRWWKPGRGGSTLTPAGHLPTPSLTLGRDVKDFLEKYDLRNITNLPTPSLITFWRKGDLSNITNLTIHHSFRGEMCNISYLCTHSITHTSYDTISSNKIYFCFHQHFSKPCVLLKPLNSIEKMTERNTSIGCETLSRSNISSHHPSYRWTF